MTGVATPVKLRTYFASSLEFFYIVLQKCCKCCERKRARGPASIQLRQMRSAVESASAWIQHGSQAREGGHWKSGDGGLGSGHPPPPVLPDWLSCSAYISKGMRCGQGHGTAICPLSTLGLVRGFLMPQRPSPGCSDWPSVMANPKSSVHWVSLD